MAKLQVESGSLVVVLSALERVGALQRADVSVPIDSVTDVFHSQNVWNELRGLRAPGTGWPGVIALGTWRTLRTRDFVAVGRDKPGYRIELRGQRFDRLIVSSPQIPKLEDVAQPAR